MNSDEGTMSQEELDALMGGGSGGGDVAEDDSAMSQEDMDALMAGGGNDGADDDSTMSQEEMDALMGGGGDAGGEAGAEDEDGEMTQDEMDALMGGGGEEGPSEDDGTMSQDDLDALLGGGNQGTPGGEMAQSELDAMFGGGDTQGGEDDMDIDWSAAFAEAAAGGDSAAAEAIETGQADMEETSAPPQEEEYEEEEAPFALPDDIDIPHIQFILELPLDLSVEIGRTLMSVSQLLMQTPGSVIELSKDADEPVEIFVGKKLMAKGEVVVVDDNFGVRIDEIISQAERIKSLGGEG